jgi:Zn-dependent peptidase ImmA (M78 family)/transcriptional regulator with XRE-family HTH domain
MATALINPGMLIWARERSGIALPDFASRMGKSPERIAEWESGLKPITFVQARQFADKAHVPFGYLFLQKPPIDELPIPDLRTLDGRSVSRPSAELLDLLKLMQQRQSWYRDFLMEEDAAPCGFVARYRTSDPIEVIVDDMRQSLGLDQKAIRGDWEHYSRDLIKRIEALGILVMRQSFLGHYTRPLLVEEFRGFAMVDAYAPLIFLNTADAPAARLFTLIHELCHLWIGQSGISDASPLNQRQEEVLCNTVAAEFLVPAVEFDRLWNRNLDDWRDNLAALRAHFHVSDWVLARRALTLGFIDQNEYGGFIAAVKRAWQDKENNGAISFYRTRAAWISTRFAQALVPQALNGQVLLREAGAMLGIPPAGLHKFAKELGI